MQRLRAQRFWLLPLLVLALQAMQAAGLRHRVEHEGAHGWTAVSQAIVASALSEVDAAHDVTHGAEHDCAAIDQHTLAATPPAWALPWCPTADGVQPAPAPAARPFIAADVQPFDARAPPLPLC